jgi:hypothetical protein
MPRISAPFSTVRVLGTVVGGRLDSAEPVGSGLSESVNWTGDLGSGPGCSCESTATPTHGGDKEFPAASLLPPVASTCRASPRPGSRSPLLSWRQGRAFGFAGGTTTLRPVTCPALRR